MSEDGHERSLGLDISRYDHVEWTFGALVVRDVLE